MTARYAIEGPAVVVPARVAFVLGRRFGMDELRRAARDLGDQEIAAVLYSWHAIAMQYVEARASGTGSQQAEAAEATPQSHVMEGSGAPVVAGRLGLSDRAVRLAAAEGRLRGTKDAAGRWTFLPEDVVAFEAARETR